MTRDAVRSGRRAQPAYLIVLLAALLICATSSAAHACQSCFGAEDSPLVDGARSGVWFLLAVTVAVQGGFAAFFIYLWRRSKRIGRQALRGAWAEPQHSSR
jgi:uncharacterized BrkB/YihY/UPF0761 family membrane protein